MPKGIYIRTEKNIPWNKGKTNIYTKETLNIMSKSKKGKKQSEETCRKKSISMKGNKYALGTKHTEETKKQWSISRNGVNNPMFGKIGKNNHNYGRKNTKDTIEKMKISANNRDNSNPQKWTSFGMKGKKHKEESKKKQSINMSGNNNH